MKGIILAGDQGSRLHTLTLGVTKQLLTIYDKPMIHYPVETLVEVGVTDILIITNSQHTSALVNALGDGSKFGARFTYTTQLSPEGVVQAFTIGEEFLQKESVCFIPGDCIILGDKGVANYAKVLEKSENRKFVGYIP